MILLERYNMLGYISLVITICGLFGLPFRDCLFKVSKGFSRAGFWGRGSFPKGVLPSEKKNQ
jgi:hypothetical protein